MTQPGSLRAIKHVLPSRSKWISLRAVVSITALCVSGIAPSYADMPMNPPPASPVHSDAQPSVPNSTAVPPTDGVMAADTAQSAPPSGVASPSNVKAASQSKSKKAGAHTVAPSRSIPFDRNAAIGRSLSRGQYLARTALNYRGVPYRWGGTSPRSGFDCSGLVQVVCAKWGIYLPRCAHEQVTKGIPVKRSQLQSGDLVFFKNTYKHGLSHVGIYVGDGWFIHAASQRTGVILSRLDAPYHLNHWYGARRLNLSKLPPVPGEMAPVPQQVILDSNPTEETPLKDEPSAPAGETAPAPGR